MGSPEMARNLFYETPAVDDNQKLKFALQKMVNSEQEDDVRTTYTKSTYVFLSDKWNPDLNKYAPI